MMSCLFMYTVSHDSTERCLFYFLFLFLHFIRVLTMLITQSVLNFMFYLLHVIMY